MKLRKLKDGRIGAIPLLSFLLFLIVSVLYLKHLLPFEEFAFCSIVSISFTLFDNSIKEGEK